MRKTMKKHVLVLLMMLLPLMASAQSSVKIDGIYYKLNSSDKTAEVVFHRYQYSGALVIPSSVTHEGADYSVIGISANAFRTSSELTSITIPSSVTSIGSGIFEGCTSLASIIIEDGNPKYDTRENCNAIIETASNRLLYGCNGTTIPNSVTSIGNSSFSGYAGLTSVIIPDGVTSIGESAFAGCSGLTSITIGSGVTTIGRNAFDECSNLTKVELNNNAIVSKNYNSSPYITDIFGGQVEEYVLGEDVKSIGEFAFSECVNLTTVHFSDGLTSIGANAFYWCSNLTEINIPSSVTSIEQSSFYGCYRLTKVELNNNALVSNDYSSWFTLSYYFGKQVEEYILGDEVKGIGNYAFAGSSVISINIPSGVTSIGDYAFASCSKLTSIKIPKETTSIGENAFQNCTGLLSIQVESGNPVYDSRENSNALIQTADNTIILGCQNTMIPNTVTAIGDYAFYNCTGLTAITIPNSVTSIGEYAFYSCTALTAITIPNSVTSIGNSVFCGCFALAAVNIPNSVTTIGEYAFSSCKSLTSVTIPNSVTTISNYAFFFCTSLASLTIPNSVTSIGSRVFDGCSGLTMIQVKSGNPVYDSRDNCNAIIETADNTLILGCKNTTIPNSVTSIGESAFYSCTGLTAITIPNNVTSIGRGAFIQCSNLAAIAIPDGVTSIGYAAFVDCWNLATIVLPKSVTTIDDYAFIRCGLKDMYCYMEQLPVIGSDVFQDTDYKAILHVPAGSLDAYCNADQWKKFKEIVALTDSDPGLTGISSPSVEQRGSECYDLSGRRTSKLQRGLNIVKMSDGTTKKVVIK